MSQGNVERGRQVMDALSGRDLPELVALSHPEVEWHSFFAEVGEGGVYHGHDGAALWLQDLDDAFQTAYANVDNGLAVGDTVVLVGQLRYRGKESGVESETDVGWMLRFRDAKVVFFRAFRDPEQALQAVGLSE